MSDECIQKRNEIAKKLSAKYTEQLDKINRAMDYIYSIPDSEIRQIYGYRYIDGIEWTEIGKIMNYDESTVRKKCRAWEKKQQNCPSTPAGKVI
jgi:DNA-directed RNA polymerase specialized sigma24 family protein